MDLIILFIRPGISHFCITADSNISLVLIINTCIDTNLWAMCPGLGYRDITDGCVTCSTYCMRIVFK